MQLIDGADVTAIRPADPADNSPGWFQQGDPTIPQPATQVTYTWLNDVQDEIQAVSTLRGASLSSTDSQQMVTAVEAVQALDGALADTGVVTSYWRRAVLASSRSQASGADSAVIASGDVSGASLSDATGARTSVIASDRGRVYPTATESCVIASTFARIDSGGGGGSNQTMIACAGGTVDSSQAAAIAATNPIVAHTNCIATGNAPKTDIASARVHSSGQVKSGKQCQFTEHTKSGRTTNAAPSVVLGPDYTFAQEGSYLIRWEVCGVEEGGGVGGDHWGDSGAVLCHWDGATLTNVGNVIAGTTQNSAGAAAWTLGIGAVGAALQFTVGQGAYANNVSWGGFFRVMRVDG